MIGQLESISLVAGIVIPPFAVTAAYLMFLPTGQGRRRCAVSFCTTKVAKPTLNVKVMYFGASSRKMKLFDCFSMGLKKL